jgi:hypothetical protein
MKPCNLPETLIWYYIIGTYAIYYIGGLYLFAPLLAIFLTGYLLKKWWLQTPDTPEHEKIRVSIPADLTSSKIIFTLVNRWFRTFGLMALFPLIGHLKIRPQLIYRAACIFCIQSLVLVLLFTLLSNLFNSSIYYFISPLSKFGGGELYYDVRLFGAVIDVSEKRLQMIAPWPPVCKKKTRNSKF